MSAMNPGEIIIAKLTPTLDTSAYAANDTLFATTQIPGSFRKGWIRAISVLDKDDVASESITFYFLRSNVTFCTFNAAPSISDTNAEEIIGITSAIVASTDLGGCKVGYSGSVNIPFEVETTGLLYVAGVTNTALTHTASGIVINFVIERWN